MSKPAEIKSINWNSATGRIPIRAAPHAAPTIAASDIGVSITRPSPNSSSKPSVTLNAPPYEPTSSPMTKTAGSRSISSQIPCRIASTKVATPPRSGRFDLCSFLIAVDIQFRITIHKAESKVNSVQITFYTYNPFSVDHLSRFPVLVSFHRIPWDEVPDPRLNCRRLRMLPFHHQVTARILPMPHLHQVMCLSLLLSRSVFQQWQCSAPPGIVHNDRPDRFLSSIRFRRVEHTADRRVRRGLCGDKFSPQSRQPHHRCEHIPRLSS